VKNLERDLFYFFDENPRKLLILCDEDKNKTHFENKTHQKIDLKKAFRYKCARHGDYGL
jgi:hypothetical protein